MADNCQPHAGATGYVQIQRNGKRVSAHRLAWEQANGPIPDGMVVRHKCDNPPCVNPDHLELGTQKDNVRDMWERGRAHNRAGRNNGNQVKLTDAQVLEIRASNEAPKSLAEKYGVSRQLIWLVKTGKRWKHVKPS